MNLSEKLKELKRLSKLNAMLSSEEIKQEKTIKVEMSGLNQESSISSISKPKKNKKKRTKKRQEICAESKHVEYSNSALSLLQHSILDRDEGEGEDENKSIDEQEASESEEDVERIGWSDPSDDVVVDYPAEIKKHVRNFSAAGRYTSANIKSTMKTIVSAGAMRPYSAVETTL
jgi:hypothetical protein